MKKILFLFIFFIGIGIVKAEEWPALESLKIKNVDYDIHFTKNKYDYYLPVSLDVNMLEIEYTTNCSCTAEITGNENFKEGVNKVVITLADDHNQEVRYTITVDKRYIAKEESKEESKKETFPIMYVGLGFGIAAIVIGLISVIKSKKTSE